MGSHTCSAYIFYSSGPYDSCLSSMHATTQHTTDLSHCKHSATDYFCVGTLEVTTTVDLAFEWFGALSIFGIVEKPLSCLFFLRQHDGEQHIGHDTAKADVKYERCKIEIPCYTIVSLTLSTLPLPMRRCAYRSTRLVSIGNSYIIDVDSVLIRECSACTHTSSRIYKSHASGVSMRKLKVSRLEH